MRQHLPFFSSPNKFFHASSNVYAGEMPQERGSFMREREASRTRIEADWPAPAESRSRARARERTAR